MKRVLKKSERIDYVSESDMVEFITKNSGMDWNDCCDFVRQKGITSSDEGKMFWTKKGIETLNNSSSEESIKWVKSFFEAHPWIERVMFVFDD